MSKYIDSEKLIAEIERRLVKYDTDYTSAGSELKELLSFIDSLQQEQPEIDLKKEIDAVWNPRFNLGWDEKSLLSINRSAFETIARHFYELGLNARKEE